MITLDIIGTLYSQVLTNDNGEYVSGGDPLPGYHVNTIPAIHGWEVYMVNPTSKRRIFAGLESSTCCYVFPTKDIFLEQAAIAGIPIGGEDA